MGSCRGPNWCVPLCGELRRQNLSGFRINSSTGALSPLGSVFPTGLGPTSVTVHPSGHFALVANSFDDDVSSYSSIRAPAALRQFPTRRFPPTWARPLWL